MIFGSVTAALRFLGLAPIPLWPEVFRSHLTAPCSLEAEFYAGLPVFTPTSGFFPGAGEVSGDGAAFFPLKFGQKCLFCGNTSS